MNTPTPEETRRLLDVENYGGKALFEFSPDSYDKVNDLIALYKSTAQRADALAEELAASNKRREELHRRIKDLEFQLHGNDTFDKLTSLQAESGRKDQLLASLGDLLKECAEKLDRYANRQTAKRALPQGGFADNRASEGQHYAQIQSLIDRARNWRKALTPPPDATEAQSATAGFQREISEWAQTTFPHQTPHSKIAHLKKEVRELEEAPSDLVEMADCYILLLNLAEMAGGDLLTEAKKKMKVNRARKWGKPDADGVCLHIKEAQSVVKVEEGASTGEIVEGDLCLCGSGHKVGECWRYASCTDAAKKKGHKFS